ncbi:hypothetical protein [Nonomuraea sp. NPDC049784]|uniref:hypothetical protein n=1 Tax=Nonomuraea sp. NPDC049784 TaxID=3154361 RepID=UPI0033EE46F7
MAEKMHPAWDEVVDDRDEEEGGIVIVEERDGPPRRRWVRYVMPVMVEADPDTDQITLVVTLPEEVRDDRDDMGNFCVYDETFVRRRMDYYPVDQPELHAWNVAQPRWSSRFRVGGPDNWPELSRWEEGFDLTEADDVYAEVNPYADPR